MFLNRNSYQQVFEGLGILLLLLPDYYQQRRLQVLQGHYLVMELFFEVRPVN